MSRDRKRSSTAREPGRIDAQDVAAAARALAPGCDVCLPGEAQAISRRQLLRTGVSVTAYASVASLMASRDAFAAAAAAKAKSFAPQRKLIWITMSGGWDILEATDPKPGSTGGIDMVYGYDLAQGLAGAADGTRIGRWLPSIAALGEEVMVVRGLAMGTTSHEAGSIYMDTGILSNAGRVNAASIPAIVASESGATIPIIQLNGGTEAKTDRGLLKPVSVVRAENLELYRSMYPDGEEAVQRKMAVLEYLQSSVTRLEGEVGANDRLSNLSAAADKVKSQFEANVGAKLALTDADRAIFRDGAPTGMGMGGGTDPAALALKLINNDIVTCVNLGFGGFDTHQNQTQRLEPVLASADFLIGRLVEGLRQSGKLDSTLIVLFSDFGRTPKVNGSNGRDHWPTGGAIVIGGGIAGGRSVGATDDNLQAADLVDPDTGLETSDSAKGVQLNPTHLGGMVLALTLGTGYGTYRPYLEAIPAMTRLRSK
jgi:hypothetical protein